VPVRVTFSTVPGLSEWLVIVSEDAEHPTVTLTFLSRRVRFTKFIIFVADEDDDDGAFDKTESVVTVTVNC
jgi:hypothetical protein